MTKSIIALKTFSMLKLNFSTQNLLIAENTLFMPPKISVPLKESIKFLTGSGKFKAVCDDDCVFISAKAASAVKTKINKTVGTTKNILNFLIIFIDSIRRLTD